MGYNMDTKINDPELTKIVEKNTDKLTTWMKKFGFDPRDETWIYKYLAEGDREKNWFKFETENSKMFSDNWNDIIAVYNKHHNDNITVEESKMLSKRRIRYVWGAHYTRMSGNNNINDWRKSAKEFEQHHKEIEERMMIWSITHKDKFPLAKTIKPILFNPGKYFNQCIEKIPQVFDDPQCRHIKEGEILRVVSYDKIHKYIRLDFVKEIRNIIIDDDIDSWLSEDDSYVIWLKPEEIETHLDILDSLE